MDNRRVLIVDDEPKIGDLLADYFGQAGYAVEVQTEGSKVVEFVRQRSPDVVILDLMLPGKDGLQICREVREFSSVPIIMLTARIDEIDRLLGLEFGADDYVCKPFSPREIVARVKAILRRVDQVTGDVTSYRGIRIDAEKHSAELNGAAVNLTPVEFRLLALLVARPGNVFSRQTLIENAYEDGRVISDRSIDSHIKNLRKKLHAADSSDEYVHSIYGVGYKVE